MEDAMIPVRSTRAALALLLPLLTLLAVGCGPGKPKADLVLRNGMIVTVDSVHPRVAALAAIGDTIVALGSDADIQAYIGPSTRVIDLHGQLAIPGFIDSHAHFMSVGEAKMELDVMHVRTWDDIVAMVKQAATEKKPGEWILGRGWHQEKWSQPPARVVAGFPTNDELNSAAPDNPVLLTHASGHAAIANAKALEMAGITASTPNPVGGEIIKDARGRLTGMLVDAAQGLARGALDKAEAARTPEQVQTDMKKAAELAAQDAVSKGVTSIQDQGESFATIDFLRQMEEEGQLPVRLFVLVSPAAVQPDDVQTLVAHRVIDDADGHFTVRAIGEITADGALGSHSAWMLQPYNDEPNTSGIDVTPLDRIKQLAEIAIQNDFQIATHAIGDRANREVLDIYQQVFKEHPDKTGLRWRVEHAQHLTAQDIPRFAQMGVIASMQGVHACSDGPYVVKRLGEERARVGAYAWRKLWNTGAVVTNGTDAPVEDIDPIASFYCSVTRKLADGSLFFPEETLSRAQALRSYTLNGAYAAFQEHQKGSLTPGKMADIVVLSTNIMTAPPDSIPDAKVLYTIIGGKIVYQAKTPEGS
jgi:predicted amidohydrolase YtcJ